MVNNKLTLSVNEPTITQISAKQGESGRTLHMSSETVEDGTLKMTLHDGTSVSISAPSGVTGSGSSPLSVDSVVESSVTALDLYGKSTQATYSDVLSALSLAGATSQSGTPTPSSPIDIVGVGQYDTVVTLDGSETWTESTVGTNYIEYTSSVLSNKNATGSVCASAMPIVDSGDEESATVLSLVDYADAVARVIVPNTLTDITSAAELKTYFTNNPCYVWYQSSNYTATSDVYFVTTFTDSNSNFVKSIGTTTASPHLYEGDTFDFVTGTVTRAWASKTYSSSSGWFAYSGYNGFAVELADMKEESRQVGYCTIATYITDVSHTPNTMWFGVHSSGGILKYIYLLEVADSIGSTVADLGTYLTNNPMTVVYQLATATTSTLPLSDTFFFRNGDGYTFSGDGTLTATYSGSAPSPNYPVSIVSVTNPSVSVLGKNIFDVSTATIYGRYISYSSPTSAQWKTSGDSGSYAIKVSPNTTYAIKVFSDVTVFRVCALNVDPSTVGSSTVNTTNAYSQNASTNFYCTITTASDEEWLVIQLNKAIAEARTAQVQVEVGSTSTDYEAYVAPTTYSLTGTLYALPTTNSALANYTDSNNQKWIADVWDAVSGDITRYCGVIDSYASESINEPWLSTMDVYSSGTTPTTGATVVYTLSDTTTETGTANTITLAKGTNTLVYADDNSLGNYMEVDGDYGENIATLTELSLSVAGKAYCSLEYSDISTFPFIINVLENHDAN